MDTKNFHNAHQLGMSLIEVLAAMLVLTIGLLGLATLQNKSLKLSHDTYLRSHATILLQDLIARASSNTSALAYSFNGKISSPASSCLNSSCSPSQLRQHDLYSWQQQLYSTLPNVQTASLSYNSSTNLHSLNLAWHDRSNSNTLPRRSVFNFRIKQ